MERSCEPTKGSRKTEKKMEKPLWQEDLVLAGRKQRRRKELPGDQWLEREETREGREEQ